MELSLLIESSQGSWVFMWLLHWSFSFCFSFSCGVVTIHVWVFLILRWHPIITSSYSVLRNFQFYQFLSICIFLGQIPSLSNMGACKRARVKVPSQLWKVDFIEISISLNLSFKEENVAFTLLGVLFLLLQTFIPIITKKM